MKVYEQRTKQLYHEFAGDFLYVLRAPWVRKAYKKASKKYSIPKPERDRVDDIRDILVRWPDTDIIEIYAAQLDNLDSDAILKKASRSTPPGRSALPFVVNPGYLDVELLLKCLYSGAVQTHASHGGDGYQTVPFWLVPLWELQALGHFSKALDGNSEGDRARLARHLNAVLEQSNDYPGKQHLLAHSDYWNNPDNIGSIDELIRENDASAWPEGWDNMKPRHLLNALRELEMLQRRGPDVPYDYLKDLPDKGSIRVLRSYHEVCWVAGKLNNCAHGLAHGVERKRRIFVVLQDCSGKPIALGSHPLPRTGEWREQGWDEIREANNRRPSEETNKRFNEYTPIFRRWYKTVFRPAHSDLSIWAEPEWSMPEWARPAAAWLQRRKQQASSFWSMSG